MSIIFRSINVVSRSVSPVYIMCANTSNKFKIPYEIEFETLHFMECVEWL